MSKVGMEFGVRFLTVIKLLLACVVQNTFSCIREFRLHAYIITERKLPSVNKGADQPAHLRSLISAYAVCCLDSTKAIVAIFNISTLWLASVAEKTGLNLA